MEDLCADCVGKTINRRLCFRFILVPVLTAPPTRSSYESCSSSYEECLTTAAPAAPPTAPHLFLFTVADLDSREQFVDEYFRPQG